MSQDFDTHVACPWADMIERYPDFYWISVSPHLEEAIASLNVTCDGRQWIATLRSHVFCTEHSFDLVGRSGEPRSAWPQ